MVAMAAATTRPTTPKPTALTSARGARPAPAGADRLSVVLFSIATFLVVLSLLAWQLKPAAARTTARHVVLVKRIYTTTIVETVPGPGATSMSQSVSSSGSAYAATSSAPTTRSS